MNEAIKALDEKFTSGNSIEVERATITRDEYLELRRLHEISIKYSELLYAVHRAFPDENRHQTALRYITQTERLSAMCESAKEQA